MNFKKSLILSLTAVSFFTSLASQAQENPWMLRFRAANLDWKNGQNDGLSIGSTPKVTAEEKIIPEIDVSYFFTKNIAAELVLTYPQKVDIDINNARQGTIKALPPSLLVQYHFTDLGAFKPYVGTGVNYTFFTQRDNILGGAASVDSSSTGLVAQVGFDYMLTKNWGLNLDVKYIQIKTDVKVGVAKIGNLDLSPVISAVGLTYRF